jgi:hypothetical protein
MGTWFVLADNRRETDDSQVFGPVPRSWIIGVAIIRTGPIASVSVESTRPLWEGTTTLTLALPSHAAVAHRAAVVIA